MIRWMIGMALTLLLAAPLAMAQPEVGGRGGWADRPERPPAHDARNVETQDLLEKVMLARMARELDLSDEQLVKIVRGLGDFRERLHGLGQERAELMQSLRASVGTDADAHDTGATLDKLLELDERLNQVRADMHQSLRSMLTPEQHAQVYLFLSEFDGQMKGLLDRARERGLVGPPPDAPRPRGPEVRDRPFGGPDRPLAPGREGVSDRRDPAARPDRMAPRLSDEARRDMLRKLMERRRQETNPGAEEKRESVDTP